jgi:NitT/TauT family transport system substrate-binding protein
MAMKQYAKIIWLLSLGVLTVLLGYRLVASNRQPEEEAIRFCYLIGTETAPVLVAQEKGFFEAENLKVELFNFEKQRGTEFSIVGSGVLDGCATSKMGAIKSIAEGVPLKVVGNLLSDGGPPMFRLIAKEESDITTPSDLEGHNFGLFAGGATEYYFDQLAEKYEMDKDKINVVQLPFMEMIAAFKANRTDALIADPVVYYEIKEEFPVRVIAISTDSFSNAIMDGVIFSDQFIQDNPEQVKGFMRALFTAGEFANNHPDEVKSIFEKQCFDPVWQEIEPMKQATDNTGLAEGVKLTLEWIKSKGQIDQEPTIEDIIWSP